MAVPLFAALAFPSWVIQAHIQAHPELHRTPFALVNQVGQRSVVIEVSPAAARLGVYPGANQWRARRRHPQVQFIEYEEEPVHSLWESIQDLAESQSPRCMILKQGLLLIDLTGMQQLFPQGERGWALQFQEQLLGLSSPQAPSLNYSLVLSPMMGSAVLLSRFRAHLGSVGAQYVPEPICFALGTSEELEGVPLHLVLGLTKATRTQLKQYQLRTLGQVHQLSLRFLRTHFAQEGELLWMVAQGRSFGKSKLIVVEAHKRGTQRLEVRRDFGQDVMDRQKLKTFLHDLVDEIAFELRLQHKWSKHYKVEVIYSDQKSHTESFTLPQLTHQFVPLIEVVNSLQERIFQRRVSVRSLQMLALRCVETGGQGDLFDQPSVNSSIAIQEALDQIRTKHGFSKIGNP